MQTRTKRAALVAAVLGATLVAVPFGGASTAVAATTSVTGARFEQTYGEDFATDAAAGGQFARQYADSWQPYPDGTGGMWFSGSQISAHDGFMDVALDGRHGAAGTFGTPAGAWGHQGGKFTVRAMATGGDRNGAAFILYPTSNRWADGEIDFPESNFESTPMAYQHLMIPGLEGLSHSASTGVSWRDWHTYSVEWIPGQSVTYLVDDRVVQRVTSDVPTTPHRYMFQVGNWGASGHLYINWVSMAEYVG